ncbi:MAG: ABC transporter ATP-binding protein [Patescibacteria group bacterium]|nr:ABC transporter ATP-binding protein [Patescibacteria group bacterium]
MNQQYKLIARIISQNKALFAMFFVFSLLQSGLLLLVPYFSKLQIDQLENQFGDFFGVFSIRPEIIFVIIVFLAVLANLLERTAGIFASVYNRKINYTCSVKIEKELYNRIEKFDIGFMQNPRNRRIVNSSLDLTYIIQRLADFISSQFKTIITVFGILPIMAYFSLEIFAVVVFFGIVQIVIMKARTKKDVLLNLAEDRTMSRFWQLQNLIFYQLQNIANIDDSNFIMKKYWDLRKRRFETRMKIEGLYEKYSILELVSQNFTYAFTAIFAGYQVVAGNLTIGSFTMLLLYTASLQSVFNEISSVIPNWKTISIQFHKLGFFLNLETRLNLNAIKSITNSIEGGIILKNVCFSYPNFYKEEKKYIKSIITKEEELKKKAAGNWYTEDLAEWEEIISKQYKKMPQVLKKVNCVFEKGKISALVGRNGSGKTTLSNLITRNYDPKKGSIKIGNNELLNIEPKYLKKFISIIPQEPFLLESFSIRENISFGGFNKNTNKKIWELLKILDLEKDIKKLPKKLNSIIGEDVQFSGGQSQLLSIARVLMQDRPIIIFDEGTNQLDAEHEAKIMDILKGLKKEKTIIMITHRMTTARKADKIYVIDEGKIIETGKHQELIKKKRGLYKKFWDLQVVE